MLISASFQESLTSINLYITVSSSFRVHLIFIGNTLRAIPIIFKTTSREMELKFQFWYHIISDIYTCFIPNCSVCGEHIINRIIKNNSGNLVSPIEIKLVKYVIAAHWRDLMRGGILSIVHKKMSSAFSNVILVWMRMSSSIYLKYNSEFIST